MKIISFKQKKMNLLTNKQQESNESAKSAVFVRKSLKIDMLRITNIKELGTSVIIQVNTEVLRIAYVI